MRFHLVDRILEIEPGRKIRMVKNLTLAEEYLADHFPGFPVMPGVLMLQTLVESNSAIGEFLDGTLAVFNGKPGDLHSFDLLDDLLDRQAYRLAF